MSAAVECRILAPEDPRHGTYNGYKNFRCRCERCREAAREWRRERDWNAYRREWTHRTGRNKPLEVHLAEIAAKHGTESKYSAGCRCDDCRAVAARARRSRRKNGTVSTHNASGYKNGCRCEVCRVAFREFRRKERVAA